MTIEQQSPGKVKMYEHADHYTLEAKKLGYPARSVFKLIEIDKKFQILPKSGRFLDIGSAPGSWSLYILSRLDAEGRLYGCDLQSLEPDARWNDDRFTFFLGDAFASPVIERLKEAGPFDVLLSDAAPSTTGNRTVDTSRSEQLVDSIIFHLFPSLKPGGNFIAKIFQGGAEKRFTSELRPRFASCALFKPQACRKNSFETFIVCKGFRN
jgi:23S rRNA (uridine2552-2'-O)-methyltransferase